MSLQGRAVSDHARPRSIRERWLQRREHRSRTNLRQAVSRTNAMISWPLVLSALAIALLANIGMGAVDVSPRAILSILGAHIADLASRSPFPDVFTTLGNGLLSIPGVQALRDAIAVEYTRQQDSVVWAIRLPRTLMATIIGAGLATSGATMQGMFRNPLADPGLIGVSTGAALGAASAIVLGFTAFGLWSVPFMAVIGGGIVTTLVYLIARNQGRTEVVTLLLAGVAINAVAGAAIGLLMSIANDNQLRSVTFWTLGSLGGSVWHHVGIVGAVTAICLVVVHRFRVQLNLLALGERESKHLGVNVERTRLILIIATAAMTGVAVAFSGAIGFVGLVVPHMIRLWQGPDHRRLIPLAAAGGAVILLAADLASRTIAAPTEFPIGVTMSLIGGPFFLWLLLRVRSHQGGWG